MLNLDRRKTPPYGKENIRTKLMQLIIKDCNNSYNPTTLINSKRQTYLIPLVQTIKHTVKSNTKHKSINNDILNEKKFKFEKAMKSYKYLQFLSGKSNIIAYSPSKFKKMSLKADPVQIKDQTDKALQSVNFDILTNLIIEKTNDSKKKAMTKKELKIDTEIEISEFNKFLPSPSEFNIVKTTMSNLSNYSNDFTLRLNRCVTTSSDSSYNSQYMLAENCHRYHDYDDNSDYYSREFQLRLNSSLRKERTFSEITPTSSDLEFS
jgi:hypothetical protein